MGWTAPLPASAIYEAAGVLQISPSSTNPLLTELSRANVFRVINRDDVEGRMAANYLAYRWPGKKIAISMTTRPSERVSLRRQRSN
jgi:branched-chain amino acid transport system substrate-binding protein